MDSNRQRHNEVINWREIGLVVVLKVAWRGWRPKVTHMAYLERAKESHEAGGSGNYGERS